MYCTGSDKKYNNAVVGAYNNSFLFRFPLSLSNCDKSEANNGNTAPARPAKDLRCCGGGGAGIRNVLISPADVSMSAVTLAVCGSYAAELSGRRPCAILPQGASIYDSHKIPLNICPQNFCSLCPQIWVPFDHPSRLCARHICKSPNP